MKAAYNFNIEIEVPPKTNQEELLFLKWKPILRRFHISPEIIEEYKNDLLSLKLNPVKTAIILLLFTSLSFSQSNFIAAGKENFTVGETFPIMQQVDTIIEVNLGVPKFELPEPPKPKPIKKQSFFDKIIALFKSLFKK